MVTQEREKAQLQEKALQPGKMPLQEKARLQEMRLQEEVLHSQMYIQQHEHESHIQESLVLLYRIIRQLQRKPRQKYAAVIPQVTRRQKEVQDRLITERHIQG